MPQATGAWAAVTPLKLLRYLASLYAHPQPVDELMQLLHIDEFATTAPTAGSRAGSSRP